MSRKEDESQELDIPPDGRTVIRRPMRPAMSTAHGRRVLFSPKKVDRTTCEFEIVTPGFVPNEKKLRDGNPKLMAFRNHTAKSRKRQPAVRPKTVAEGQGLAYSLLKNRPVTAVKSPKGTAVQFVQRNIERERDTIKFFEDPVAYFAKRKDGSGHRFIYLNYAGERTDPNFSPYALVKVPQAEINPDYFTMSANGVTRIQANGNTEQVSLDTWTRETAMYQSLRKLRTFRGYSYWKPFREWKRFVLGRRYNLITKWTCDHPYFRNAAFFQSTLEVLKVTSDAMIKSCLLAFAPQKKFLVDGFRKCVEQNKKRLMSDYSSFLGTMANEISELSKKLRDPQRLVVKDEDFQEIKRRNPNLERLKMLEKKLDAERRRRIDTVNMEVMSIGSFVRMIDYNLLESMAHSCFETWRHTLDEVSQDESSIFLVDLSFNDEGHITFSPSLEELTEVVNFALTESFETLANLPRVLFCKEVTEHLTGALHELAENGPGFMDMIAPNTEYERVRQGILRVITKSYQDSEAYCTAYKDFFAIFQLSGSWDPKKYVHPRGGGGQEYNLSKLMGLYADETEVIYDPRSELALDFLSIRADINRFQVDEVRLGNIRSCIIKGLLYIDSKKLRNLLAPIPVNSLITLKEFLMNVMEQKMELINKLFTFCGKKLKKEPTSLEEFVDYCQFTQMVEEMTPFLAQEIAGVDELSALVEDTWFTQSEKTGSARNRIHDQFKHFRDAQGMARGLRDINTDKFVLILQQRLRFREQKLTKYNSVIMSYPMAIQMCRVDVVLPKMTKVKEKLIKLAPEIAGLQHCQEVMSVKLYDLSTFSDIKNGAIFTEQLYQCVNEYTQLRDQIVNMSFSSVQIPDFVKDVKKIDAAVQELRNSGHTQNSLLMDLVKRVAEILPHLNQLLQLFNGRMSLRHWNRLFDECGQANCYTPQVTIHELISLGILAQKERIEVITSTSQGESKLETDFRNIKTKWQEVQLPLLEQQAKSEDSLILGDVKPLFIDIADAQIALQSMLEVPFVQGIKKEILELTTALETYAQVMDAWQVFQSNWTVLASFFAMEETKTVLEAQEKKFAFVKRRWMSLIRHTLENLSLFHICAFPSLLEMLIENNRTLEGILVSSGKFLEGKRSLLPRLYFLSNEEMMTMFSTTDFSVFNGHLIKMFMHVKNFDFYAKETGATEKIAYVQDFSKLRIFGIVSESNDSLALSPNIMCEGAVEKWVGNLIEAMKKGVKDSLYDSVQRYTSSPLSDWILTIPMSIAALTLNICFTRDIDECFHNYDSNPRVFINYENTLIQRIQELANSLSSPLSPSDLAKVSCATIIYNSHLSTLRDLSEKIPSFSQQINWANKLKARFNAQTRAISVEFGDMLVEHGYEFWGIAPRFVQTPASERVLLNVCTAMSRGELSYVFGGSALGKNHLLADIASYYGRYCYFLPAFVDASSMLLSRAVTGAMSSGCWLVFHSLEKYSNDSLCFIHDTIRDVLHKSGNGKAATPTGGSRPTQNSFVFFTGTHGLFTSPGLPHQVRSSLKPIGFAAPDVKLLVEIKLSSFGFKATKAIAQKLVLVLGVIPSVFPEIQCRSIVPVVCSVIDTATVYLRFVMHSSKVPFVNYYESARTAEEYAISRACFEFYEMNMNAETREIYMQLLYTHFQIFNNYGEFSEYILDGEAFEAVQTDHILRPVVAMHVREISSNKRFVEYITDKTMDLFHLMERYSCIVISGSVNSGKSLILNTLSSALDDLITESEGNQKLAGYLTMKIFDMFHMIETRNHLYGEAKTTEDGDIWLSGHLQSYARNLMMVQASKHAVLRMNGPIGPEFAQFLGQMIDADDGKAIRLNSMDTILWNKNVHLVVETETVAGMDPISISRCAVLHLDRLDNEPSLVFERAVREFDKPLDEEVLVPLSKIFCALLPSVVQKVMSSANEVWNVDSDQNIVGGDGWLMSELGSRAVTMAFHYLEQSFTTDADENSLRIIMILSLFMTYSPIVDPSVSGKFDDWMRMNYAVPVPHDWVGFNVPDHFWNLFRSPTLESLRFYKGKLIPVDLVKLTEKPITRKRMGSLNMRVPEDTSVCTGQYLPLLHEIKVLVRYREDFMLVGPRSCGKTTLLRFAFQHVEDVTAMTVPITMCSTASTVQGFIEMYTPIITKSYMSMSTTKPFALIFDNVPPENEHITEFIRMIAETRTVPVVSRNDPKFLDTLHIRNMIVIVVAHSWKGFSARFLSRFNPLRLGEPKRETVGYILKGIGAAFGVAQFIVDAVIMIVDEFSRTPELRFPFMRMMDAVALLDGRAALNERDGIGCVKCVLAEANLSFYHRMMAQDLLEKFDGIYDQLFPNKEFRDLHKTVLHGTDLIGTRVNIASDFTACSTVLETKGPTPFQRDLRGHIKKFNETKGRNKIVIHLSQPELRKFRMIHRVLTYPGGNVILKGEPGSGRSCLVKLVCRVTEATLFEFPVWNAADGIHEADRSASIRKFLATAIYQSVVSNKVGVVLVRVDSICERDWWTLAQLIEFRDFYPFFDEVALEDMSYKFAQARKIKGEQKSVMYEQICINLFAKLRFALVVSPSFDTERVPRFTVVDFTCRKPVYATQWVTDFFKKRKFAPLVKMLPDQCLNIFETVHKIVCKAKPDTCYNQFYEYVTTYARLASDGIQKLTDKDDKIKIALKFIAVIENELDVVDRRITEIKPCLDVLQGDPAEVKAAFGERKAAVQEEIAKTEEQERLRQAEVRQIADELVPLRADMIDLQARIHIMTGQLDTIQTEGVEELQAMIAKPPPALKVLSEMLCVFLEKTPQYEPYGRLVLSDPDLMDTLKGNISHENVQPQMLAKARHVFTQANAQFDKADFAAISITARTLHQWIDTVYRHAFTTDKLADRKEQYEKKTGELAKFIEGSRTEKDGLNKQITAIDKEQKELLSSLQARESYEAEFKTLESRKGTLITLCKGLDVLGEKWQSEMLELATTKHNLLGNTFIFATYLVYFGNMTSSEGMDVMNLLFDEMKARELPGEFTDPMQFITSELAIVSGSEDIVSVNGGTVTRENESDIQLLRIMPRTPLIVDPDEGVINRLASSFPPGRVVLTSMLTERLADILILTMRDGLVLMINDVTWLHPLLETVLPYVISYKRKETDEITIKNDTFVVNPQFRLFLFTNTADVSRDLSARTIFVDVGRHSLVSAEEVITSTFVDFFDPEMMPRVRAMVQSEIQYGIDLIQYESATLDNIAAIVKRQKADPTYDYLGDEDAFGVLLHAKECYFATANVTPDTRKVTSELRMTVEPYANHIGLCKVFWEAMSRYLPRISPYNIFSFEQYIKAIHGIIHASGLQQGTISVNQHAALRVALIGRIIKYALPRMSFRDNLFFLFIAGFLLNKSNGKTKDSDLESILEHFTAEFDSKCDYTVVDPRSGDPLDQLKYSNIVNIFNFMAQFIMDTFGQDVFNQFPILQLESFVSTSAMTPVFVRVHDNKDPTQLIEDYVGLCGTQAKLVIVSLCDNRHSIRAAKEAMKDAIASGNIVLMHTSVISQAVATAIYDFVHMIENPAKDFRLILVCSGDPRIIPRDALLRFERYEYETFPSMRHQLLQILQHHSTSMISSSKAARKLSYAVSLLYAIIQFRGFVSVFGFTNEVFLNEMCLKNVILRTKDAVEITLGEMPIRNIRNALLDVDFGASVTDSYDARKLKAHVYLIAVPDVIEDGFAFIDQQCGDPAVYSIPDESLNVMNWPHNVEKIPAFPYCEALCMNRIIASPIRNWTMSRWVMDSFLPMFVPGDSALEETRAEISRLLKDKIPPRFNVSLQDIKTPLHMFLLREIEKYNLTVALIRNDLAAALTGQDPEVSQSISRGRAPLRWNECLCYGGVRQLQGFLRVMRDRHALYDSWNTKKVIPLTIDSSWISNIRGLLECYLIEIACQRQSTIDVMGYEFVIGSKENEGVGLTISGLALMGGNWDANDRKVIPANAKTPSVTRLPECFCGPVKTGAKMPHTFMCPMYKSVPSREFMLAYDSEYVDGEVRNLQWTVPIRTDIVERHLLVMGVALVCHAPDNF